MSSEVPMHSVTIAVDRLSREGLVAFKWNVPSKKGRSQMSRLSFALLVSSSITFLLGGFADSNAASTNDPRDHKGRAFRDADVKGAYAFSFDGVVIAAGPVAATGVVIADGNGNITSAVRTLNFNGAVVRQTFTCTYSVNPNGTGSAECPVDDPLEGAPAV